MINYLQRHTQLSNEDIQRVSAAGTIKMLHRNEVLLQHGQICRYKTFIVKGLLRTYGIAENGSEHILQFSPENTWTLDAESYDLQVPSQFNIDAVEDSEIVMWAKPDFERLLADIPTLRSFASQLISRNIYNSRQRLLSALSATPEEKYEEFVKAFPGLLSRLPLRMIASYLGISIKTLTRIRHTQIRR